MALNRSRDHSFSIAICGGGIIGLSLAIRLRQLGLDPLLIEMQSRVLSEKPCGNRPQAKGELFLPLGVRSLRELGLLDSLLRRGVRIASGSHRFKSAVLGRKEELRASFDGDDHALAVPHEQILLAFYSEYEKLGGQLLDDVYVRDVTPMGDHYVLDLSNGEERVVDCFVGADGRYSTTRKMAELPMIETGTDQVTFIASVEGLPIPPGKVYSEEIPGGALTAFVVSPSGAGRVYLSFEKEKLVEANSDRSAYFARMLQATSLGPSLDVGEIRLSSVPTVIPAASVSLKKRSKGRGIWIGDAAGTLEPVAALSMSLGLCEAMDLANTLFAASKDPAQTTELLTQEAEKAHRRYVRAKAAASLTASALRESRVLGRIAKKLAAQRLRSDDALRSRVAALVGGTHLALPDPEGFALLALTKEIIKNKAFRTIQPLL